MAVDKDFAQRIIDRAIPEAMRYFEVSSDLTLVGVTEAHPESKEPACVEMIHAYHRHDIHIVPERCHSGEDVWCYAGHEVAHSVTRELLYLHSVIEEAGADEMTVMMMRDYLEMATARLEGMFARDCPYPGDEAFAEAADESEGT